MLFCAVTAILLYLLPGRCDQEEAKGDSNVQNREVLFSSAYSQTHVRLFATPWTAACQASLSITNSQSLLKPMSIESVMPSNHLILCRTLLLCLQSFPASGSFQMSQFFASGGQSIGASASAEEILLRKVKISDGRQLL